MALNLIVDSVYKLEGKKIELKKYTLLGYETITGYAVKILIGGRVIAETKSCCSLGHANIEAKKLINKMEIKQ